MAKAKRDNSRKQKLTNFKNAHKSKKMSNNIPKSPIAKQYPVWKSQDSIEMSGLEFEAIYNFTNIFRNAVMASESVLQKNIQNGKIHWKFEDESGKELPQHVVEAYQKEIQAFFEAQQKAQATKPVDTTSEITAEEQKDLPKIDALVDVTGKPLTP